MASVDYILLNSQSIAATEPNCSECNKLCYAIRDCETGLIDGHSNAFAVYLGKTIKWQTESYLKALQKANNDRALNNLPPLPIDWKCGTPESYVCFKETYVDVSADLHIEDCFDTCDECLYVAPEAEKVLKVNRHQKPGYDVPECTN